VATNLKIKVADTTQVRPSGARIRLTDPAKDVSNRARQQRVAVAGLSAFEIGNSGYRLPAEPNPVGKENFMKKGPHQRGVSSSLSRIIMALIVFLTSAICMAGSGLASQFEIPDLVAPGSYQLEMGYTYLREADTSPDTSTHSLPAPTFITGVIPNLEIELLGDGLIVIDSDPGSSTEDGSDFSMFGKFGITSENGWVPSTAGRVGLSFPTGGGNVTSDGFDPSFTFIAAWAVGKNVESLPLPEETTLYLNFGFAGPTNGRSDSNRYFQYSTVVTLAFPIVGDLSGFVEYFNSVSTRNIADTHSMDAGVGYQFTNQFYTEVTFEAGLNDAASDFGSNLLLVWTF
jgi:hypothetical protein